MNITINISADEAIELINKIESMSIIKKECGGERKTGRNASRVSYRSYYDKKKPDSLSNKARMIRNNIEDRKYARLLTKSHLYWETDPHYIMALLRRKELYLNDKLSLDGFVTLNQIYRELGFGNIEEGDDIRWINNGSYIHFDMKEIDIKNEDGNSEPVYLIDFNFDECLY